MKEAPCSSPSPDWKGRFHRLRELNLENRVGWKVVILCLVPAFLVKVLGAEDSTFAVITALVIGIGGFLIKVVLDGLWLYDHTQYERKNKEAKKEDGWPTLGGH